MERNIRLPVKAPTPPEVLEKRKAYYQRPEVKERYRARAATEEYKEYHRKRRAEPETKKAMAEYARMRYHFPPGLYDQLMEAQGQACALCRRPFDLSKPRSIHSDHCHIGKHARGLLCSNCNTAEGHIKSLGFGPEEFGRRLAAYLADPPAKRWERGEQVLHG